METPTKPTSNHIGRKISRIRELRGIKQETLASEMGISQQTVSRLEQSEAIEDEVLEKIAGVLGVAVDAIKNFDEERAIHNIQYNYDNSTGGPMLNYGCTFNPIDKIVELYNEKVALLERLLESEKEKVESLKNK